MLRKKSQHIFEHLKSLLALEIRELNTLLSPIKVTISEVGCILGSIRDIKWPEISSVLCYPVRKKTKIQ